jgi:hypothetical protein
VSGFIGGNSGKINVPEGAFMCSLMQLLLLENIKGTEVDLSVPTS